MKYTHMEGVIKEDNRFVLLFFAVIFAVVSSLIMFLPSASAATVPVTSSNVGSDWSLNDTRAGGSVDFISDTTSPLGGALQMTTTDSTVDGDSAAKAQLFNYDHIGTGLDEITDLSFSEYRNSSSKNSSVQRIGLNMEVDYAGDGSTYTTLVFEPVYNTYQQALADDTWQTWDAIDSGDAVWWSTSAIPGVCAFSCYVSWNDIVTSYPDAVIKYGVGFNVGSGWAGDFTGRADALTLNATTYDFELDTTPPAQVEGMTIVQDGDEIGCSAVINDRAITVDWNDSTASDFDHYVYQADDDQVAPYDYTITTAISERSGMIRDLDGTYSYRVAAVDENGNQGAFSNWCSVTLDREAPVVEITSHNDGDVVSGTVDVSGSVEDANPWRYYTVVRDSSGSVVAGPGTEYESSSFTNQMLFSWDTTMVPNGTYTLWLAAKDEAGNRDDSVSLDTVEVEVNNPPQTVAECKAGAWATFVNPREFKNQGDCVSFIASDDKAKGNPEQGNPPAPGRNR